MSGQEHRARLHKVETARKATPAARGKVLNRVAVQRTPYLRDAMQGFVIQLLVTGRRHARFAQVTLEGGGAHVRFFDTVAAGTRDVQDACLASLATREWGEVAAFLARHAGIRLEASCKGRPADIRLCGHYLAIHEVVGAGRAISPCALVDFVSGHGASSVQVTCLPDGPGAKGAFLSGWDWVTVEEDLAAHGITLKPSLVSAAPVA